MWERVEKKEYTKIVLNFILKICFLICFSVLFRFPQPCGKVL